MSTGPNMLKPKAVTMATLAATHRRDKCVPRGDEWSVACVGTLLLRMVASTMAGRDITKLRKMVTMELLAVHEVLSIDTRAMKVLATLCQTIPRFEVEPAQDRPESHHGILAPALRRPVCEMSHSTTTTRYEQVCQIRDSESSVDLHIYETIPTCGLP